MNRTTTALLLALLAVPGSAAVVVSDSFSNHGSSVLDGPHDLVWQAYAVGLAAPSGRNLTLDAAVDVSLVNLPLEVVVVRVPDVDRTQSRGNLDEEVQHRGSSTGVTSIRLGPAGEARFVCGDGEPWDLQTRQTHAHIAPAGSRFGNDPLSLFAYRASVDGVDARPTSPHTVAVVEGAPQHPADGCTLVATSGEVTLPGSDAPIALGRWLNESRSSYDAVTGTGRYVYDTWFVVLRVDAGTLWAPGDWTLAAARVEGSIEGSVSWNGLARAPELNGTEDPSVLELEGRLDLEALLTTDEAHWAVAGDATGLYVDKELIWSTGADVAAGLGVLGLAALFVAGLRGMATLLMGRSTPAAVRVAPLTHPKRRLLLRVIHQCQPVRLPDLQRRTGISRGALRYHLRVLVGADILQSHAPSGRRNATYMLNSGSLSFLASEAFGADAVGATGPEDAELPLDVALSVAHGSPQRQAILDGILARPRTAAQLLEHLAQQGAGISRSTLSYHLGLLVEAGVVVAERSGRTKTYQAAYDPALIQAEQYARYLHQRRALPLVELLSRAGPTPRTDAREHLRHNGHGSAEADGLIDALLALSLLEERGSGRLALTPFLAPLAPHIMQRGAS